MRSRAGLWGILVILLLSIVGRAARADEASPITLAWNAPQGCPDVDAVKATIRHLLSARAASSLDTHVVATGTVRRTGSAWHVDLVAEADGKERRRTLEGDTCASLADASALLLAILVNPDKVAAQSDDHPPPAPSPPVPPAERPAPPSEVPPSPTPHRTTLGVGAFAAIDVGTMPQATPSGGLALGGSYDRWRGELVGMAHPYQTATLENTPALGIRYRTLRGGARVCWSALLHPVTVGPCAGMEVVSLRGQGTGLTSSLDSETKWGELVMSVDARWEFVPKLGVFLDIAGQVPLVRRDLVVAHVGVVHTIPPLTSRIRAGAFVLFDAF
jgi:hypothetical protein